MRACACLLIVAACATHDPAAHMPVLEVSDSQLAFSATNVGQATQMMLRITNTGDALSGPLTLSTTSTEFTVIGCDQRLDGGEACDAVVGYAPIHAGATTATLTVAADPGGSLAVALNGDALVPVVVWEGGDHDFGIVEANVATHADLVLRNTSAAPAPLDAFVATGGFDVDPGTCGETLAGGATCTVTVSITPTLLLASYTGGLSVVTSGESFTAPLRAQGGVRLTVNRAGNGSGTITSSPAGIACGATCTALFATPIVLTATGSASTVAWSEPSCGSNPTCTIPLAGTAAIAVTATFTAIAPNILHITVDGGGAGDITVTDYETGDLRGSCNTSCDVSIIPGEHVRLTALSPALYGGLSGACNTTDMQCDFTVNAGVAAVTAAFHRDPHEVWDALPDGTVVTTAAFDSTNALVTNANGMTKFSPTGAVVWHRPSIGACNLAVGAGDRIYVQTPTQVIKLLPDGSTAWSRALDPQANGCGDNQGFTHNIAVGPAGEVAIRGWTGIAKWDTDGNFAWARPLGNDGRFAAAIRSDGVVMAAVENPNGESTDIVELTAAGDYLTTLENVTSQYHGMFVLGSGGLVATGSGHSHTDFYGPTFASVDIPSASYGAAGVCSAGTGDAGWVYSYDLPDFADAWTFIRYHADGSVAQRIDRALANDPLSGLLGTGPYDIAASADGHIAIVGGFMGPSYIGGWIEVLAP